MLFTQEKHNSNANRAYRQALHYWLKSVDDHSELIGIFRVGYVNVSQR